MSLFPQDDEEKKWAYEYAHLEIEIIELKKIIDDLLKNLKKAELILSVNGYPETGRELLASIQKAEAKICELKEEKTCED